MHHDGKIEIIHLTQAPSNQKGENTMPYVNLKLIGKLNREQKQRIAKEFSETLMNVAGKPKEYTYIVIEEIAAENWAQGDKLFG